MKYSLLIADDEINSGKVSPNFSNPTPVKWIWLADGKEALEKLQKRSYDVLITDIRMPGIDGMTLLKHAKEIDPAMGVIVLTAYGTIEMAVQAMRLGAYNYLTKPVILDEMELLVEQLAG